MKILFSILTGILAGILTGWLAGGAGDAERNGGAEKAAVQRPPAAPAAPTKPAEEKFELPAKRAGSVRSRIRFEQSILKLSPDEARGKLRAAGARGAAVDEFAAVLLGWRAADPDPAAALAAAGDSAACAGVLRRWLLTDAGAALDACGTSEGRLKVAFEQYAEIDPANCVAAMSARKSSVVIDLREGVWAARDPQQAQAWVETNCPKQMSEFYRGWMLADAPAAVAAASRLPFGGEQWTPPNDWIANAFSQLRGANLEFAAESFRKLDPGQLLKGASPVNFMLSGIADWDIEAALQLARDLEPGELRDTALSECAQRMFNSDVPAALELARSIQTPRLRNWALSNIAHALGETDPAAADPVMETLPPMMQYGVANNLLEDFRVSAPALAEKWEARCRNVPIPGPEEKE